ncbi:DNA-binding protein [Paraburkholderia sp. BR10936]|uniref:DNA-binding protein n=1 Tax=Paraburkholderia sp. BR10936 TaxID=3236993 RepID=UPI0034D1FC60
MQSPYIKTDSLAALEILSTNEAAAALGRRPQTLRKWAALENGPILPLRINGRLAWRVADLKKLLTGDTETRTAAA